ncbi:hypothetical protein KKF32_00900 [Patescibacteria group bacterium]|nr:hypothetical protein [Patescibacteria group bacterium]
MIAKASKRFRLSQVIQPSYRNIIIIFSFLAAILVLLILYFTLSQAVIIITPAYSEQKIGFIVQVADQGSSEANFNVSQRIPGLLKETVMEETQEFSASQNKVSQNKASGKLTIYNDYSQSQPLVATTRFQTPEGLIFRLPEFVTVPAKGKLEVTVEADQEGSTYEIGPSKFILPALSSWRRQYVYAESFQPMSRASYTEFKITEEDIAKATDKLKEELMTKARQKMIADLQNGQTIFEKFLTSEILKYSISEKAGSKKENFKVSLSLSVKALILNEEELKQEALADLPEVYQQADSLVKIDQQSFIYKITPLEENSENLLAQIKGEYTLLAANINIDKNKLKGLSRKQAENYLLNLSDVREVRLHLPFWTKYLPALEDNINIEIKK